MENRLWYRKPAGKWIEALPLGNGRLGCMVFGGVLKERIQLNEDTLWTGVPKNKKNENTGDFLTYLKEARRLIFNEEYSKSEKIINEKLLGHWSESYAPMGNLYLDFGEDIHYENYTRELDLDRASVVVNYTSKGVRYRRTAMVSKPDDSIIIKFSSSEKGKISFKALFDSLLKYKLSFAKVGGAPSMILDGKAPIHVLPSYVNEENSVVYDRDGRCGMNFRVVLIPEIKNGRMCIENGKLKIENADEVVLKVAAHTSFNGFKNEAGTQGKDVKKLCENTIGRIYNKSFEQMYIDHLKEYKKLFDRVDFNLKCCIEESALPTDERLKNISEGKEDLGLISIYFQYGRYLLISSSRKGTKPANLQGIWNEDLRPAWSSNYTTNINLEMNYWPAEVCNLSECHEPLFEMLKELLKSGEETAKLRYGCRGWTANHNIDLWLKTTPAGGSAEWAYWPMAGAWLCSHIWQHYEFTMDKGFLEEMYPIMKGAAQFLMDFLIEDNNGYLVTCPSISPENNFTAKNGEKCCVSMASTMDMAITKNLFNDCIKAADVLEKDYDFREKLKIVKAKLYPYKIGKYGQLQEWYKDFKEFEVGHRHLSPLFGLFPGNEIKEESDKKILEAARVLLKRRLKSGGGYTGWSCAWVTCLFARLKDSKSAGEHLNILLRKLTYSNLFNVCPPFQVDGNFGAAAAITEMLLQSHEGYINLLPAMPIQWKEGHIKGLRARGGFQVDMEWKDSFLKKVKIKSFVGGNCKVKYNSVKFKSKSDNLKIISKNDNLIEFQVEKGGVYEAWFC